MNDDERLALRDSCDRFLHGHGPSRPDALLAALPDGIAADTYGEGGVVAELEDEVAALLGLEAAAFFPSGTMAQQIALRIHADERDCRTVIMHPTCHVDLHEDRAYERLHQLQGRLVGSPERLWIAEDLDAIREPVAAAVFELPAREIGGRLPTFDTFADQAAMIRAAGSAVHVDGARLWQVPPAWGVELDEIAAHADSVYVSFYKDLGAITGACLAGDEAFVDQAREWRKRHGGTLYALWPYASSARAALRTRLPRMSAYREHALAIAAAVADRDDVVVTPDPPHASLFHVLLRTSVDAYAEAAERIAREQRLWTGTTARATGHPDWVRIEISVGDATLALAPDEVADVFGALAAG